MHIEAHCGVCLDLNYLLAYIALAFIAGCHLFSCLFYSCKFGFDNKQFNRYIIFFFGLWFSILLNFFVVESVLCPKTLFSTDVSLILEFSFQHISIFLILDCSRTVNLLLEKKKPLTEQMCALSWVRVWHQCFERQYFLFFMEFCIFLEFSFHHICLVMFIIDNYWEQWPADILILDYSRSFNVLLDKKSEPSTL
jgi:hypothetical protein